MKFTFNIKPFLGAVIAITAAIMTATAQIDNYIHFAGEANAMAFFLLTGMMGLGLLAASFEVENK